MSPHLVRYAEHVRREFERVLVDVSEADAEKRVAGLNSVAWMTCHLALQEQSYWLLSQGQAAILATDSLKTNPSPKFQEMLAAWRDITGASQGYLEHLSAEDLSTHLKGRKSFEVENIGSLLTRLIGHYYFHIGQVSVIRKILGYEVPSFVGSQEGAYYS